MGNAAPCSKTILGKAGWAVDHWGEAEITDSRLLLLVTYLDLWFCSISHHALSAFDSFLSDYLPWVYKSSFFPCRHHLSTIPTVISQPNTFSYRRNQVILSWPPVRSPNTPQAPKVVFSTNQASVTRLPERLLGSIERYWRWFWRWLSRLYLSVSPSECKSGLPQVLEE